jgi:hypothetical protein
MNRAVLSAMVAIGAALGTGCGSVGPEEIAITATLDRTIVTRGGDAGAAVLVTIANAGRSPAYFRGCVLPVSAVAEEAVGSGWRDAANFGTPCPAIFLPTVLSIEPGRSYRASFPFVEAGRFRLRLLYGRSAEQPFGLTARTGSFTVE